MHWKTPTSFSDPSSLFPLDAIIPASVLQRADDPLANPSRQESSNLLVVAPQAISQGTVYPPIPANLHRRLQNITSNLKTNGGRKVNETYQIVYSFAPNKTILLSLIVPFPNILCKQYEMNPV